MSRKEYRISHGHRVSYVILSRVSHVVIKERV